MLAVTATAIGFAFDAGSGNRELSAVFAVCYSLGCLSAVLAVRQNGLFTAVIQPPLILFAAVPGSYFLFHGGELNGLKDLAINCGYPLIERFPLMLFISAAVLLIGLGRWYVGLSPRRRGAPDEPAPDTPAATPKNSVVAGIVSSVTAKLSGLVLRKPAGTSARRVRARETDASDASAGPAPRRRPAGDRPPRRRPAAADAGFMADPTAEPGRPPRAGSGRPRAERPTKRTPGSRPRPARGADADLDFDAAPERPRRPRPPRPADPVAGEPRRRPRTQPREPRDARDPREPRKQPPPERRRAAGPKSAKPFDAPLDAPRERPQRPRRRFDDYQPFEDSFEPTNGHPGRSTHHPVSRVRYRGSDDEDNRVERRTRPRSSGQGPTTRGRHSWEYDS